MSDDTAAAAIRLGDIFLLDWTPGRGSEQTGRRPAVVVQNDAFNANPRYPNTVVAAISKSGRDIPTHVSVRQNPVNGLWEQVSYVKCEQIFTVSKDRLTTRLGRLSDGEIALVASALKRVLGLR